MPMTNTLSCEREWLDNNRLEIARQLVKALETGNDEESDRLVAEITSVRETTLFQNIGKLTRELHDSIVRFSVESNIAELANHEIPDAKERLTYVITMTEQAANTTLNSVEELDSLAQQMEKECNEYSKKWQGFSEKQTHTDELKVFNKDLLEFFSRSEATNQTIRKKLNEVMVAQSFQDITGQIIRRVIQLIQDVESKLVELISASTNQGSIKVAKEKVNDNGELAGPAIPGVNDEDTMSNQDDVDDLLSSLGF